MEILIIDDSIEVCESLSLIIESLGHEAKFFLSPVDAIAYFNSEQNPVVLLDVHLPDSKGTDILPYIKSLSPFSQVIMMTGESDISLVISSLKNQASDFLFKPFSIDSVRGSIEKAVNLYSIQKENHNYQQQLDYNLKFISNLQRNILFPKLDDSKNLIDFYSKEPNSGSFYYTHESHGKQFIFFGEVEGNEVTSGLIALLAISIFKECIISGTSISTILYELNNQLYYKVNLHSLSCVAILRDIENETIQYSSIGFPAPCIINQTGVNFFKINKVSILGVIPNQVIDEFKIQIQSNDILFLYSSHMGDENEILKKINECKNHSYKCIKEKVITTFNSLKNENYNLSFLLKEL